MKNHNKFVEVLFQCLPSSFKGQFQEQKFGIFLYSNVFAFSTTTFGPPLKIVQQFYQNCSLESRRIVRGKNAYSVEPYLSKLFELQSTEFMILAKSFDRVVESAIYEFGEKCWRKSLFAFTIFRIFFWLWAKLFLILVWIFSTGLWKLHFMCSEEISWHFWKSSWLFRRLRILNEFLIFFKFGRTISTGLSKGLLKSRWLYRGKIIVFEEPILLFSFFELRAEIYRILEKNYRVVVKTGWNMFSGSFGGKNFSEKALIPNQFRTLSDFSSNYC